MRAELPGEVERNRSEANGTSVDDALRYIEDSRESFNLFQGHRMRVINQKRAIAQIHEDLKAEVLRTKQPSATAIVTMDFKQKYLEKRLRSSQMNDFGQRGITWHIVVIEYYEYEPPCEVNGNQPTAMRVQLPLDQILNSGNKQDGPCVLAMLEAMLKMVEVELSTLKNIILVSDNANCYHSKDLILPICILNQRSKGPLIVKFIHPETQDGKAACDSHAGTAGTLVDRHFICTRQDGALTYNDACTPTQLAHALCSNGGVKNSGKITDCCVVHLQGSLLTIPSSSTSTVSFSRSVDKARFRPP